MSVKLNLTASAIAKLRRTGATWIEVAEAEATPGKPRARRNSTFYGRVLAKAGYDRKGRKLGSNQKSKARAWGPTIEV